MAAAAPLVCHGHSRPIVNLEYSQITEDGTFLISSSKGACVSDVWVLQVPFRSPGALRGRARLR